MPGLDNLKNMVLKRMAENNNTNDKESPLHEMAEEAIDDEEEGVKFYTKMLAACKDPQHRAWIQEALDDEKKHAKYMKQILNGGY